MSEDMLLILQDAFTITGRGTVLVGELVAGSVAVGDEIVVTEPSGQSRVVRVTGVESKRKLLEGASVGIGQIGLLVDGVRKDEVARGSSVRGVPAPASRTSGVPAAWLADPAGRHQLRYWDGTTWTAHVADAGVTARDPLAAEPPAESGAVAGGSPAAAELEALRARVTEVLLSHGPTVFAPLKLDIDLQQLPERIVSLGAELERADRPGKALDVLHRRAAIYEVLGMQTEADRDRLAWAAIKEGHSGLRRTSKAWAVGVFGLEHGATFAAAYDLSVRDEGKRVRVPLMRAGRAIALGYCTKCGGVQQLDEHLRCQRGHTKIEDVACVVPEDMPETRAALQAAHSDSR